MSRSCYHRNGKGFSGSDGKEMSRIQINGTEEAVLGRNMLEMFVLKQSLGKLLSTLLLVRFE